MASIKKTQDNSSRVNKTTTPIERPIPKIQTEPNRQGPRLEEIASRFGNIKGQRDSSSRISDRVLQDLLNERGGGPGNAEPANNPPTSPSATPSVTPSVSTTPSTTPTVTPSPSPEASPSVTPTNTPTVTPSISPSITPSPTPEATPSVTPTPTPSVSSANIINIPFTFQVLGNNNEEYYLGAQTGEDNTHLYDSYTVADTVTPVTQNIQATNPDTLTYILSRKGDADGASQTLDANTTVTVTVTGTFTSIRVGPSTYINSGDSVSFSAGYVANTAPGTYDNYWYIAGLSSDSAISVVVNEGNV